MKPLYLIIFVCLLAGNILSQNNCKNTAGIYTTFKSFQNNPSNVICLDSNKNKIYFGILNNLIIKSNGKETVFKPGEIYGFYKGNKIFRYFEDSKSIAKLYGYFNIKDTSGLIIYDQINRGYKHTSINYYYSKTLNETIKNLNVKNLESDFNNPDFILEIKNLVENLMNQNSKNAKESIDKINLAYKKYYH